MTTVLTTTVTTAASPTTVEVFTTAERALLLPAPGVYDDYEAVLGVEARE